VLGKKRGQASGRRLDRYDASALIGLRTIVRDAAIERVDEDGVHSVELPKMRELAASAAVARCLTPIRLRGAEIKAMRKIMGLTLAELAKELDERTAPETVSRWESEAQPMGGYLEKLLRLLVCKALRRERPACPMTPAGSPTCGSSTHGATTRRSRSRRSNSRWSA
jgi:DNA-binding transcriptional regulator YiaG